LSDEPESYNYEEKKKAYAALHQALSRLTPEQIKNLLLDDPDDIVGET